MRDDDPDEKRTIEITREEAEHFAFVLNLQRVLLRDEIQHIANKRSLTNAQKAETVAGCRKRLEMVTDLNTRICRTFHINGY